MNESKFPAVIYHNLNTLIEKQEIEIVLNAVQKQLNQGHIASIVNAFFSNTKICINGIPYIKVKGLATILRTGSSGAERPLIYQGIKGVYSPSDLIEIDGQEHISGASLIGLINARLFFVSGKTKQYLEVAIKIYERIINLSQIRDLKEVFLDEIDANRPYLKKERIERFFITRCEFTGKYFENSNEVEFAHIESVSTNPLKALDITNGVIILKYIHKEMTKKGIHDSEGMYNFCKENHYSTKWLNGL